MADLVSCVTLAAASDVGITTQSPCSVLQEHEAHDFSKLQSSVRSLATSRVLKRSQRIGRSRPRRTFLVWLDSVLPIILPTQRIRRQAAPPHFTHAQVRGFTTSNCKFWELPCRYWDFLIVFFVVYNAIQVPLEAAFTGVHKSNVQRVADIVIDVLFALDVVYTFRTAYVDEQGMLVRDGLRIAKRYFATWFPIDMAASLPLEIIALWFGVSNGNLTYLAMLKARPRRMRSACCHLWHRPAVSSHTRSSKTRWQHKCKRALLQYGRGSSRPLGPQCLAA